jgi:hypothetical protein
LWQRDLSISHERIGDVQAEQGDLAAALTSYRTSIELRMRLAKADPRNVGWQRDVAASYGRIALIKMRQGVPDDALNAFRLGRNIVAQLVQQAPGNPTLRNDLAWFDRRIDTHQK